MTIEKEIKHYLILYRMGEYNADKTVKEILAKVKQHYEQKCGNCTSWDWIQKHAYHPGNIVGEKSNV